MTKDNKTGAVTPADNTSAIVNTNIDDAKNQVFAPVMADILAEAKQQRSELQAKKPESHPLQKVDVNDAGDIARSIYNPYKTTDMGNAERLIQVASGNLRFIGGDWYYFQNGAWRPDAAKARELVKKGVAGLLWKEVEGYTQERNEDAIKKLISWARHTESTKAVDSALRMAHSDPAIFTKIEQMDADPMLLNCKNGTLNLESGILTAHNKSQLLSKQIMVDYNPAATCPKWQTFIDRIFNHDAELIEYMQKAVGYSLTGSTKQQVWFLCFGHGANGKSVFINTILELLNDYGLQSAPDLLLQSKQQRHPAELAALKGKRMAVSQESDEGRLLAEGTIKQLTGTDVISARKMHKDFFEFTATHKIWLATNHKPAVRDTTESTWRRLKLIPFAVTIPEPERNHNLQDELRAEFQGILSWAVQGCLKWQKYGLKDAAVIKRATASYRDESDTIGLFIEECAEKTTDGHSKQSDVYDAYTRWAIANGHKPIASRRLRQALEERHYMQSVYNGARVIKNLKLIS
jgi:putative DNA primase/helicase